MSSAMQTSLLVLAGKQKDREIVLPETLFVIGRDPLCHLRPHSILVSRRHCAIARWGTKVLLRDLKSGNGTFLNHKRINEQVEVHHGDILQVGDLIFSFQIKSKTDAVEKLTEDSILWLIEDPNESAVLDSGLDTVMGPVVPLESPGKPENESKGPAPDKAKAKGSKGLSAGKYFRDYFHREA